MRPTLCMAQKMGARLGSGQVLLGPLPRDYQGLDILEADFGIVRLGLRYKL